MTLISVDPDPEQIPLSPLLLDSFYSPSSLWWQYVLFLVLIFFSFVASGAEVAFFSLSRAEIDDYRENESPLAQRIWKLVRTPKKLLATILITSNFVNVTAILVASNLLAVYARQYQWSTELFFFLEIALITSIILFFGEIIPKAYASRNRQPILQLAAPPIEFLNAVLSPISYLLIQGTQLIDKRLKMKESDASIEDMRQAIELTSTEQKEEAGERELLRGIVNFSNTPVKSVMRARVDMAAVEMGMHFDKLLEFVRENNYSRMPVYEDNLDNIKGILHIKDLLPYLRSGDPQVQLSSLLRDAYFIPESKKIDALLEEFREEHRHMAIVVDEFGGTAGLVTLEDIIEEVLGEINDEFDSEDWVYTKISDDTYIFEGRISLIDVRKIIGLDEDEFEEDRGSSDSLGGLILELHGKIPNMGEVIRHRHFAFHIESVSRNRIAMVKLQIHPETDDDDE
ncbi:MAG: gliding motility-associated protein GldE [Bacteroidetes bacterium]|nr:MAG: gliding motility-associated protein GldE [Bacteroidota bacterium]